jgi:hypothetical protein
MKSDIRLVEVLVRLYEPETSSSVNEGPSQDTSVPVEFDNVGLSLLHYTVV